jgi:hypothetical protein
MTQDRIFDEKQPAVTASPRKLRVAQLCFLSILFLIFLTLVSRFAPYLSPYGDVQGYIRPDGFNPWNYQPIWPYIASSLYSVAGTEGIFVLQAALYFASATLLFFAAEHIRRRSGWILAVFCVVNIRAYFYIANPLTEIFNIFLFSLGLFLWTRLSRDRATVPLALAGILLVAGLSRSANMAFLALLLMLVVIHFSRGDRHTFLSRIAIILPPTIIVVSFNVALQHRDNNTGVNLLRFVMAACSQQHCAPEIFTDSRTPAAAEFYERHRSLDGFYKQFETDRINFYKPQLAQEMKTVYLNLLLKEPVRFAAQVVANYRQQVGATFLPPYPEDTNLSVTASKLVFAADRVVTAISCLIAAFAPFIIAWYLAKLIFASRLEGSICYLLAWLMAEVMTSQAMFSNLWISDASRMRFHYEIPGLLLLLLLVLEVRRIAVEPRLDRRSRSGD